MKNQAKIWGTLLVVSLSALFCRQSWATETPSNAISLSPIGSWVNVTATNNQSGTKTALDSKLSPGVDLEWRFDSFSGYFETLFSVGFPTAPARPLAPAYYSLISGGVGLGTYVVDDQLYLSVLIDYRQALLLRATSSTNSTFDTLGLFTVSLGASYEIAKRETFHLKADLIIGQGFVQEVMGYESHGDTRVQGKLAFGCFPSQAIELTSTIGLRADFLGTSITDETITQPEFGIGLKWRF